MDNPKVITVNDLKAILDKLSDTGYGDMKIMCMDGYLHDDEIGYNYSKREVTLCGCLFNIDTTQNVENFCKGVRMLERKFLNMKCGDTSRLNK